MTKVQIKRGGDDSLNLNDLAKALTIHPRTVLRALTGDRNVYWASGHNPVLSATRVANALGLNPNTMRRAVNGNEELLRIKEAAALLDLSVPSFRRRLFKPAIQHGSVVRYARSTLMNEYFARNPD